MRKLFTVLFVVVMAAALLLASCAAPTPQVIERTVVVPQVVQETVVVPQVVQQTVVVPQVVQETVVVPATPAARPKLSIWIDHYFYSTSTDAMWKAQALQFAAEQGFDLEYLQDVPEVVRPKIDAAIESKQLPDIYYSDTPGCAKLRRLGLAADVTDVVDDVNKNMGGLTPGSLAAVTQPDGKRFFVPFAISVEEFYVRKDLLEKAGLEYPKTWEDALTVGMKLNDPPNVWGWGLQFGKNYDTDNQLNALLWAYGASPLGKDGKTVTLDSPETRQVLDLIKRGWDAGIEPKDTLTGDSAWNNKVYQTGKAAMIQNTGSVAKYLAANDKELLDNTILGVPPAGPKGSFVSGSLYGFCVSNTSQHLDLAKGLIKYFSADAQYKSFANELQGFRMPIYLGLDDLKLWNDPFMKPLKDNIPITFMVGYPGPMTDTAMEVFNQQVLYGMVSRMLTDNWTADQAIQEAVEKINKIAVQVNK